MNGKKPSKEAVIKARCDAALKLKVDQIASIQQLDTSDIVRIAVANYCAKFMQPLGDMARG